MTQSVMDENPYNRNTFRYIYMTIRCLTDRMLKFSFRVNLLRKKVISIFNYNDSICILC